MYDRRRTPVTERSRRHARLRPKHRSRYLNELVNIGLLEKSQLNRENGGVVNVYYSIDIERMHRETLVGFFVWAGEAASLIEEAHITKEMYLTETVRTVCRRCSGGVPGLTDTTARSKSELRNPLRRYRKPHRHVGSDRKTSHTFRRSERPNECPVSISQEVKDSLIGILEVFLEGGPAGRGEVNAVTFCFDQSLVLESVEQRRHPARFDAEHYREVGSAAT